MICSVFLYIKESIALYTCIYGIFLTLRSYFFWVLFLDWYFALSFFEPIFLGVFFTLLINIYRIILFLSTSLLLRAKFLVSFYFRRFFFSTPLFQEYFSFVLESMFISLFNSPVLLLLPNLEINKNRTDFSGKLIKT